MSADAQTFRCDAFKLNMPGDRQRGFCAVQFRKGREICVDCERGKSAAKETKDDVRASLPDIDHKKNRSAASERAQEILKSGGGKMAAQTGTKNCIDCKKDFKPTSNVQKRCLECKKKNKAAKKSAGTGQGQARPGQAEPPSPKKTRRVKGHNHDSGECEGCKALQLQIDDLSRAEKIMVAAGLVSPEKFEQARKIVRDLTK